MPNIKVPSKFIQKVVMPEAFQDQFDTVSGIGGKHLAPKKPLDYIVSFLTLTVISALVAGGGILGLRIVDASVIFSRVVAEDNGGLPQIEISIVDGTNTGLATSVGDQLLDEGWNIVSAISLSDLDPDLEPAATTLIFLSAEENRDEAAMLLANFPNAPITVSEEFASPITVLLGTDYLD
jgi:hypothetical protein